MSVELGLLIRRSERSVEKSGERVKIDATFAFVDANDQVVGREVVGDSAIIGGFKEKSRPDFSFSFDVPEGTRVVLGLGRAIE
jgi:hypothetical protein